MDRRDFFELGAGLLAAGGMAAATVPVARAAAATAGPAAKMDAAAFHKTRRFVDLSSGRISYYERGQGRAALFVHGFPLNGFQWRGVIDRLQAHRRCIAPDLLGLGYTEPNHGQSVAPDAQVAMLDALLERLGVTTVDLVGNDSGGAVAQLFAIHNPRRVRSLLLTNCDTEINSPPPALEPVLDLARKGDFANQMLKPLLADKVAARGDKGIGGQCFTYRVHPTDEALETYIEPLTRNPDRCALTDAYGLALAKNPLAGAEARLKQLNVPARILWGDADDIFPLRDGEYLDSILPGSRGLRRIEGAKLFYPEEFPDLIADEAKKLWGVA